MQPQFYKSKEGGKGGEGGEGREGGTGWNVLGAVEGMQDNAAVWRWWEGREGGS